MTHPAGPPADRGAYPGPARCPGPVPTRPPGGVPGRARPPVRPAGRTAARRSAVCVRHPDRATGLACTRCGRPACPECLRPAAVGAQCVDCVREGNRGVRRWRTVAGARPGRRPLVVPILIALNVAVFAATVVQARSIGSNFDSALFDAWALEPGEVRDGEWWRLVTAGFLHIGPIHLLFNMMALWVLGRDLETGARARSVPGPLPDLAARRGGRGDAVLRAERRRWPARPVRCSA